MADKKAALLATLARDINCLRDSDRFKRRSGLDALQRELFTKPASRDVRASILLEDVGKTLLDLLGDSVESVRETTLALLTRFLAEDGEEVAPRLFSHLLPALSTRVGSSPALEEAEELRLQWSQLLTALLAMPACAPTLRAGRAFEDVCECLKTLAGDSYHSIKCEALGGMVLLCTAVPDKVHLALGGLAGAGVGCLGHQRGPVRAAALLALQTLLPLGGDTLPTVLHDTVLPAWRLHTRFDRTPSVRKALAIACGHLLGGGLPGYALKSHGTDAILLHTLTGLCGDETEEVAGAAFVALCSAAEATGKSGSGGSGGGGGGGGGRHEGMDLETAAQAASPLVGSQQQPGYQESAALAERTAHFVASGGGGGSTSTSTSSSSSSGGGSSGSSDGVGPLPPSLYFHPITSRPSPTTRSFVARLLPATLTLALDELKDWTVRKRVCAAGSLRALVVLGEGGIGVALEGIIAALCLGSRDEEGGVRKVLGEVGKCMGVLVPSDAQLGVLLPILRSGSGDVGMGSSMREEEEGGGGGGKVAGNSSSTSSGSGSGSGTLSIAQSSPVGTASALAVLSAALSTMSRDAVLPLLSDLSSTLVLPHLAASDPPALRTQLALSFSYLVKALGGEGVAPSSSSASSSSSSSASSLPIPTPSLINLLLTLLHLEDTSSPPEILASAQHSAIDLAALVNAGGDGSGGVPALFSAHMPALLSRLAQDCATWTSKSVPRKALDALLRRHRGALGGSEATARSNVSGVLNILGITLAPSKEAELRLLQLVLLDAWVSGESSGAANGAANSASGSGSAGAGVHGAGVGVGEELARGLEGRGENVDKALGDASMSIVRECLQSNLVWRPGLVAGTIRKVSVAALLSQCSRPSLLPTFSARSLLPDLLPTLKSCLADDDTTTRHLTARAWGHLLARLGAGGVDGECLRTLFPELLKRLDDSNDAVRCAGCSALGALPGACMASDLQGMPAQYTIDTLLVHLDDGDAGVQAAVYRALVAWVRGEAGYGLKKCGEVRGRMRHTVYVDKLVAYCTAVLEGKEEGKEEGKGEGEGEGGVGGGGKANSSATTAPTSSLKIGGGGEGSEAMNTDLL